MSLSYVIWSMIKVYTDGSCVVHKRIGGWCAVICTDDNEPVVLAARVIDTTSNRMEMQGCIESLTYISDTGYDGVVGICTDSEYVYKGVTSWVSTWQRNGWRTYNGKPVVNKDLWIKLSDLSRRINTTWIRSPRNSCDFMIRADSVARKMSHMITV